MLKSGIYKLLLFLVIAFVAGGRPLRLVASSFDNSAFFCMGRHAGGRRKQAMAVNTTAGRSTAGRAVVSAEPPLHRGAGAAGSPAVTPAVLPHPGAHWYSFWRPLLVRAAAAAGLVLHSDRAFLDTKGFRRAQLHFV